MVTTLIKITLFNDNSPLLLNNPIPWVAWCNVISCDEPVILDIYDSDYNHVIIAEDMQSVDGKEFVYILDEPLIIKDQKCNELDTNSRYLTLPLTIEIYGHIYDMLSDEKETDHFIESVVVTEIPKDGHVTLAYRNSGLVKN